MCVIGNRICQITAIQKSIEVFRREFCFKKELKEDKCSLVVEIEYLTYGQSAKKLIKI